MNTKPWILAPVLMAAVTAMSMSASAQTNSIDIFTEDLTAFDTKVDLGDGTTYGVVVTNGTPAACPFGTGDAMRLFDFLNGDKPELQGELDAPIFEPFKITFQACNQSVSSNASPAIRWRMANSGKQITKESRCALSVSWRVDLTFSANYLTSSGTVSNVETAPLTGVHDFVVVGNGFTNDTYSYSFAGESRTLDPLTYDVFVDNILLNSDPAFSAGLPFTVNLAPGVPADNYDPNLGMQRFGFVGSSNSDVDPDVWFDNVILGIGEIISGASISQSLDSQVEGLSFTSTSGTVYALQSSTNEMAEFPDWLHTGMEVVGDGSDQVLFDPTGFDTNKGYRVVEAP